MAQVSKEAASLLHQRHIAALGTVNPDGTIHLTAVWYLFDGDHVAVPTGARSRKAQNVERTGTASLMVDVRSMESMRGVAVAGRASVVGGGEARRINAAIHQRYLTSRALSDPVLSELFREGDDVTVRISCDSVTSWDMGIEPLDRLFAGNSMHPLGE